MGSKGHFGVLALQDAKPRIENAVQVASFQKSSALSVLHFVRASARVSQAAHAGVWKSADSLQQQLITLVFDRVFKMKNTDKARECLSLLGCAIRFCRFQYYNMI